MPVSIKMSQGIFKMKMDQLEECYPDILCIHDDLHVYGKTEDLFQT